MRVLLVLAALVAATLATSDVQSKYYQYQVHRVIPQDESQVKTLRLLETESVLFPFWKSTGRLNDPADILVAPHLRGLFNDIMTENELKANIMVEDVQELFDNEAKMTKSKISKGIEWTNYYNLTQIYAWLDEVAAKNPNVTVVNAGKTYEGRDLKGIEIINGAGLPGVIFESGIHAREWIGPAATSWIINEILNSEIGSRWRQFNYLYFPVTNPDGYEYTWTTDRSWRKTRVPYTVLGVITCYGADPNRNWDNHWNEGGSSNNPCSETYAGPAAFSEPEVKNLANYLASKSAGYDIYVGFHSYSQLLMYPWGYTGTDTPLEATWKRIGLAAAADLEAVHGTQFEVGSIYDTIYQVSGSSIEWYYANFNSTLTYVFELRDTGKNGFVLPPEEIIPSGEELIKAIERFLVEYQKLPPKNK